MWETSTLKMEIVLHKEPFLQAPFSMVVCGPSGSGKSSLLYEMLTRPDACFQKRPTEVVIAYSKTQDLYARIVKDSKLPVRLVYGLTTEVTAKPGGLLIFDDLTDRREISIIKDWFVKYSHHLSVSVVYLIQNLYNKDPFHRTISLNTHYLVFFNNPRDRSVISNLARQMAPQNPSYIIDAYRQVSRRGHGYLVFDFKQNTPDHLRVRAGVFGGSGIFADIKNSRHVDISVGAWPAVAQRLTTK